MNKERVAVKKQQHSSSPRVTHKPGEIPKYLINFKIKREEGLNHSVETREEQRFDRIMPEEERLDLLSRLKERRKQLMVEFQRFSHTADHSLRRKKYLEELTTDIDSVDSMIVKMLSPVVIIKE